MSPIGRPAMVAGLALASTIALAPMTGSAQTQSRPVVAVLDFTNSSLMDHETYDPFRVGVAAMLSTDLQHSSKLQVVERERLRQILDEVSLGQTGQVDQATAVKAGKILGVRYMIFGVFVIDRKGNLRIDARAVSVETSRVEHVETVTDDADNLLRAISKLGKQLSTGLNLTGGAALGAEDAKAAKRGQVLANLKYCRAIQEEDRRNVLKAVELYRAFLAESPPEYAPAQRKQAEERIRVLTGGGSN